MREARKVSVPRRPCTFRWAAEWQARPAEHLKKCVLFHFVKNLFLGALLAFLCSECIHNLDLETTTQTFMLHARPSPLCASASARRTGRATILKKRFAPEISLGFWCAHASSYDCMPFCPHMSACGMHFLMYAG